MQQHGQRPHTQRCRNSLREECHTPWLRPLPAVEKTASTLTYNSRGGSLAASAWLKVFKTVSSQPRLPKQPIPRPQRPTLPASSILWGEIQSGGVLNRAARPRHGRARRPLSARSAAPPCGAGTVSFAVENRDCRTLARKEAQTKCHPQNPAQVSDAPTMGGGSIPKSRLPGQLRTAEPARVWRVISPPRRHSRYLGIDLFAECDPSLALKEPTTVALPIVSAKSMHFEHESQRKSFEAGWTRNTNQVLCTHLHTWTQFYLR